MGIYFREPSGVNNFRAGNRNTIIDCEIVNNGKNKTGTGIDIGWEIEDISIKNNRIGNTNGQNNQQTGIRISENAKRISLDANTFLDSPVEVEDHHLNKQEP